MSRNYLNLNEDKTSAVPHCLKNVLMYHLTNILIKTVQNELVDSAANQTRLRCY